MKPKFDWQFQIVALLVIIVVDVVNDFLRFANRFFNLHGFNISYRQVSLIWVHQHLQSLILVHIPIVVVVYAMLVFIYYGYKSYANRKMFCVGSVAAHEPLDENSQVWPPPPNVPH